MALRVTREVLPITVERTPDFETWLEALTPADQTSINKRLKQAAVGNLGDWKSLGGRLAELRFKSGAAHRIYFAWKGRVLIILLAGGTKRTQAADIEFARRQAATLE